jgi:hypothetical protein
MGYPITKRYMSVQLEITAFHLVVDTVADAVDVKHQSLRFGGLARCPYKVAGPSHDAAYGSTSSNIALQKVATSIASPQGSNKVD